MIDLKAATVTILKNAVTDGFIDPAVNVYYDSLAWRQDGHHRPCVTLVQSGGPEDSLYASRKAELLDIRCWGLVPRSSYNLHQSVFQVLKLWTPGSVDIPETSRVKVYNFIRVGGPLELVDEETQFGYVWSSWLVKGNDRVIQDFNTSGMFSDMFSDMFS